MGVALAVLLASDCLRVAAQSRAGRRPGRAAVAVRRRRPWRRPRPSHRAWRSPCRSADASKPLPGAENAGKPGYYTVKPGDTLIRIGLETGQNWKDLVKWNNLDNPNVVEVGQVLRVVPPGGDAGAAVRPVAASPRIEARPLDTKPTPVASNGGAPAAPSMPAAGREPRRRHQLALASVGQRQRGLRRRQEQGPGDHGQGG